MADLIVLKFDDTYGAQQALAAVRALEEMNFAWADDVAVVERHKSGRVSLHTPHGSSAGGALWGGLIGMLLFWWFPPGWFVAGWLGGMGAGALAGEAMKKSGLDQNLVDSIKDELTNGTSALLLIGASGDADQMAKAFEKYHPTKVIREPIPDETVENLKEALEGQGESS
jgi:uncharacterized membrane protein